VVGFVVGPTMLDKGPGLTLALPIRPFLLKQGEISGLCPQVLTPTMR
jgi:hypothetical protein